MERIHKKLIKGIKEYFRKNNIKKAVIGLSGGIDSALSLRLAAEAVGNSNVTALIMPEKSLTKKENVEDAVRLCRSLKIKFKVIEINPFLKNFKKLSLKQNKDSWLNLKPRIRMLILYNYANANDGLVIGTSNKTELKLGYFTKYGDGACDVEVIGDLYKTEVIELAKFLKIPEKIIKKVPSAELYPGQTDEKELGASYFVIDNILKKITKKQNIEKNRIVKKIMNRIKTNGHKRKQPVVIKAKRS